MAQARTTAQRYLGEVEQAAREAGIDCETYFDDEASRAGSFPPSYEGHDELEDSGHAVPALTLKGIADPA